MWLVVCIDAHSLSLSPFISCVLFLPQSLNQLLHRSKSILTHFCDVTNVQNCLIIECLNTCHNWHAHILFDYVFTFIRGHTILLNYVLLKIKIVQMNSIKTITVCLHCYFHPIHTKSIVIDMMRIANWIQKLHIFWLLKLDDILKCWDLTREVFINSFELCLKPNSVVRKRKTIEIIKLFILFICSRRFL